MNSDQQVINLIFQEKLFLLDIIIYNCKNINKLVECLKAKKFILKNKKALEKSDELRFEYKTKNNFEEFKTIVYNEINDLKKTVNVSCKYYSLFVNETANISTKFENDNTDDLSKKNKILSFKTEFVNKLSEYLNTKQEIIDKCIISAYIKNNFLTFSITKKLYNLLIIGLIKENDFLNLNQDTIFHLNLFEFESKNNKYIFNEFMNVCKICKENHKTFFDNDKNKCNYLCLECGNNVRDHQCRKIYNGCLLCKKYGINTTENHVTNNPNKCAHYNIEMKKFIINNRKPFIDNYFENKIVKKNWELKEIENKFIYNINEYPLLKNKMKNIKIEEAKVENVEVIENTEEEDKIENSVKNADNILDNMFREPERVLKFKKKMLNQMNVKNANSGNLIIENNKQINNINIEKVGNINIEKVGNINKKNDVESSEEKSKKERKIKDMIQTPIYVNDNQFKILNIPAIQLYTNGIIYPQIIINNMVYSLQMTPVNNQ